MFFEVVHTSDSKEYFRYRTRLTRSVSDESIIAFRLKVDWILHEWDLWDAYFLQTGTDICIMRMFPFWYEIKKSSSGIIFNNWKWRSELLWKWIAGAFEYLILRQFSDRTLLVHDEEEQKSLRRAQLEKYWVKSSWETIQSYLESFRRSLMSPYFKIEKMPSWIIDEQKAEILQLHKKG